MAVIWPISQRISAVPTAIDHGAGAALFNVILGWRAGLPLPVEFMGCRQELEQRRGFPRLCILKG
jgi:hypothetical protein